MQRYHSEPIEHAVEREIEINYGKRYRSASLASTSIPIWASQAIMKFMHKPKNFLVICGNAGIGKTYICAALTEWILKTFNTSRYWHEKNLHRELKDSFETTVGEILHFLIDDDLVILDDIGSEGFSEWKEKVLFEVIDDRYNSMKPTIFTSNLMKKDFLEHYHPRIASRLFAAENAIIEIPDGTDLRAQGL